MFFVYKSDTRLAATMTAQSMALCSSPYLQSKICTEHYDEVIRNQMQKYTDAYKRTMLLKPTRRDKHSAKEDRQMYIIKTKQHSKSRMHTNCLVSADFPILISCYLLKLLSYSLRTAAIIVFFAIV